MRRYETIVITDPDLPDEDVNGLVSTFTGTITERQGQLLKSEDWGRKKLAYDVRKRREGRYVLLEYACADAGLPHEIERRLRMTEPVIKFLTVRIDNDPRRLVWEEKQAIKEKERAARRAAAAAAAASEDEEQSDDAREDGDDDGAGRHDDDDEGED